jgi:RHS-family protein
MFERADIDHSTVDLKFDDATADALMKVCRDAASALEEKIPAQKTAADTALQEFKGHFSEVYKRNIEVAVDNGTAIAGRLRQFADGVQKLKDSAARERENRRKMRDYEENTPEVVKGAIEWAGWGPKVDHEEAPTFNTDAPEAAKREHPAPAANAGNPSDTSSARPSDLRSSSTVSQSLHDDFQTTPNSIRAKAADFKDKCQWGTADCEPILQPFEAWVTANESEAKWAQVVADAFATAGSEHEINKLSNQTIQQYLESHGVANYNREDLKVPAASLEGRATSSGYANDPVNVATGNFIEEEIDIAFSNLASSCAVTRMYNSLAVHGNGDDLPPLAGVFGPGWSSNLDTVLNFSDEGATWIMPDGRHLFFARAGEGFARVETDPYWLTRTGASEIATAPMGRFILETCALSTEADLYIVSNNQGHQWFFTLTGAWLGSTGGEGTTLAVTRAADGLISSLVHELNRSITFDYVDGLVAVARTSAGERIEYAYAPAGSTAAGHLVSITSGAGTRTYEHDDNALIHRVIAADGTVEVTNTYDESARIAHQHTEYGRDVRYLYLDGGVTEVADEDGSQANVWISDDSGRLTAIIDADGGRTSFGYDRFSNRIRVIDRDGSRTTRISDSRGRITRDVTPEGQDTRYAYDEYDRVTAVSISAFETDPKKRYAATQARRNAADAEADNGEVTPISTITYEYANAWDHNPSRVVDALGGVTELNWEGGLLTSLTGPEGVSMTLNYDEFGNLTSFADQEGNITSFTYTAAGHLAQVTTPLGLTTSFTHDAAGNITGRQDPDGSRWKFEYIAGRRLVAVIDPSGARTSYEYGPSGDMTAVIDPLGRRTERTFDENGNVATVTLPNGGVFSYVWDGLSRLIRTVDPAGGHWENTYDAASVLTKMTDPTGVRVRTQADRKSGSVTSWDGTDGVRVKFDHLGRPVAREEIFSPTEAAQEAPKARAEKTDTPESAAELVVYDPAGNPVEILDAEGGLTRYEYNLASQLVRQISPAGRITAYTYNSCGRLDSVTEGAETAEAITTRYSYDADGRLTERNLPGMSEKITYDANSRVVSVIGGSGGDVFYTYDACGRVRSIRDAAWGTRKFSYDAAGQVTEVTNGLGGVTRYTYDEAGNVTKVTDPAGRITTYEYDVLGNMVKTTDPAGAITLYEYDAAGRVLRVVDAAQKVHAWGYDSSGVACAYSVDGNEQLRVDRDNRTRSVTVTDYAASIPADDRDGNLPWVSRYELDRLGRITAVARSWGGAQSATSNGAYELSYAYDADGYRTGFTSPYGALAYTRNAVGNISAITNTATGEQSSLGYDAAGALIRAQVADTVRSWTYDSHGAITGYTETAADADNSADVRVEVIRDEAGRIVGVDSAAGLITYAYDGAGQLVSARRGNERMSWVWDAAGCLIREEYTRNTTTGEDATDDAASEAAGWVRVLVYDDAAQVRAIGTYTATSVAGNADSDSGAEQVREFLAGGNASEFTAQLPEHVDLNFAGDGRTVEGLPLTLVRLYSYDAVGRRTGEVASDGSSVTMGYSLAGSIASMTTADSGSCARVQVAAGVSGDIAGISSLASGWTPVVTDPTAEVPTVVGVGEMPVPTPGVSILGAHASGGSGVRGTSSSVLAGGAGVLGGFTSNAGVSSVPGLASSAGLLDPFQLPTTPLTGSDAAVAGAVPGVGINASGALTVGGFALMGARVADPVSRSFTSRDPLLPIPGAGWVGNPYSLVGNNPVGLVDPWGLSPISREELDKARYEKSAAKWLDDNSEGIKTFLTYAGIAASVLGFVAAGPVALVVLGAVAGAAMAGASAIEENKGPDGRINWGNVGRDMLIGGAFGALGGGVTKLGSSAMTKVLSTRAVNATKPMMQATKATRMFRAARTRAIIGGTSGAANSFTQGFRDLAFDKLYEGKEGYEPKYSLQNHLASTAVGGLTGSVSGLVSPAAGSLSKNPIKVGNVTLNNRRVLETAINGGVSFTGSVVEDLASGKEVSWSKAAVEGTSGSFNGYKNFKAPTRADASTIQQLGYKSPNYLRTYLPSKHGATNLEGTMEDLARDNVTSYFKKKASGEE